MNFALRSTHLPLVFLLLAAVHAGKLVDVLILGSVIRVFKFGIPGKRKKKAKCIVTI